MESNYPKNLYLRAYFKSQELVDDMPDVAKLIKELSDSRMELIRMIEEVTEDIGIYDYLTVTEKWVDDASNLVLNARNNVSYD